MQQGSEGIPISLQIKCHTNFLLCPCSPPSQLFNHFHALNCNIVIPQQPPLTISITAQEAGVLWEILICVGHQHILPTSKKHTQVGHTVTNLKIAYVTFSLSMSLIHLLLRQQFTAWTLPRLLSLMWYLLHIPLLSVKINFPQLINLKDIMVQWWKDCTGTDAPSDRFTGSVTLDNICSMPGRVQILPSRERAWPGATVFDWWPNRFIVSYLILGQILDVMKCRWEKQKHVSEVSLKNQSRTLFFCPDVVCTTNLKLYARSSAFCLNVDWLG